MDLVNGLIEYDKKKFADPYGNGVQRFDKLTKYVDMAVKGLGDNTSSAIDVAKALYYIREEKLYEDYPVLGSKGLSVYQDFMTFAKDVFNCCKSKIYNHIALYERFGTDRGGMVESPYQDFNANQYTYSQLLLMLPLSDSELLQVKPNWTCSQIKKHVKEVKERNRVNSIRVENVDDEVIEQVEDSVESFQLNNDNARLAFLATYRRWNKCVEFDILNTHVIFYRICLHGCVQLVAVNTVSHSCNYVAYFMFDESDYHEDSSGHYYGSFCLDFRWSTSERFIIDFLRDKKIKSIDIAKA